MFVGCCGVDVMMDGVVKFGSFVDMIEVLFYEELGVVFQVCVLDEINFKRCFVICGFFVGFIKKIGVVQDLFKQNFNICYGEGVFFVSFDRVEMQ